MHDMSPTPATTALRPQPHAHVPATGLGSLRLMSVSHVDAAIEHLERSALSPEAAAALARELTDAGVPSIILSTCGRTELYWRTTGSASDARAEAAWIASGGGARPGDDGTAPVRRLAGEAVARHLFRVTCGLESQILGECEILGQVRDAVDRSGTKDFLAGVFQAAMRCSGRAHQETRIGVGAHSIASAAAQWLVDRRATPPTSALVVGAADTGLKAARHLRYSGVTRLVLANRTRARAEAAAPALGADVADLEALADVLEDVDAVVVATRAPACVVTPELVKAAMARRGGRPLAIADVSMPRAVDPAVGAIDGVALHDLSGLDAVLRDSLDRRRLELPKVEEVIEHELRWLHVLAHEQMIRPLLTEMRARIETIRVAELDHAMKNGLQDAEAVDRLTRRMVDKMLAIPASLLKRDVPLDAEHLHVLRALFAEHMGASPGAHPHGGNGHVR